MTQAIQHTPYPQLRSVNYEIEERFPDVVTTAGHTFRHHSDIAQDQLFHYYAQAIGKAVPATIGYRYVNVGSSRSLTALRRLLVTRDPTVFCLNDAPEPGMTPVPMFPLPIVPGVAVVAGAVPVEGVAAVCAMAAVATRLPASASANLFIASKLLRTRPAPMGMNRPGAFPRR